MVKSVLILAGQRAGVTDPLCEAIGVSHKADIPVAGTAMVARVVKAIDAAGLPEPFVSGYPNQRFENLPTGDGPADSVLLALEKINQFPCLVTTCDHALLTKDMIANFIAGAETAKSDICVGLATETVIQASYPETKRTYLRFSDHAVSGCNLFYIADKKGLEAIRFWQSVQHLRKKPFKLARKVGLMIGVKYLTGRLTLYGAFEYAANRIGITAAPVLLPFAEAAIDVDKVSDLEMVESILARREA